MAGDGPRQPRSRRTPRTTIGIEWLGRIDDDEKAAELRAADVFCAPSLHGESFGVVLLEAMAAQTPIVASDLPGYRNVARSGADAILVPPGDRSRWPRAGTVLESRGAGGAGDPGRQRAEEFSMDNLARRYLASTRPLSSPRSSDAGGPAGAIALPRVAGMLGGALVDRWAYSS